MYALKVMTVTEKHSKCSVFAFGFETCIKTHATDQSLDQWSSAGCWPHSNQMLLQLIDVPHWFLISMFLCVGFSWCLHTLVLVWFSCSQGWKWMVHITVMSCCSDSCCQISVKLLATCFPAHHACARALRCCNTRLWTSHQTWPPNKPNRCCVGYRLLRVMPECIYQKQQGTSWAAVINRMTYYI